MLTLYSIKYTFSHIISKVTFYCMRIDKVNVFQYVYVFLSYRNYCNGCVFCDYDAAGFFQYWIFVSVSECYEDTRRYFIQPNPNPNPDCNPNHNPNASLMSFHSVQFVIARQRTLPQKGPFTVDDSVVNNVCTLTNYVSQCAEIFGAHAKYVT